MKIFKKIRIEFALVALAAFAVAAYAATYDLWTITGTGARRNTVEFKFQAPDTNGTNGASLLPGTDNANALGSSSLALSAIYAYDLTLSDDLTVTDDFIRGSLTTAVSTTNTSGSSLGTIYTAMLAAGSGFNAVVEGQVLCSTTVASDNYVSVYACAATDNLNDHVGVAVAAASTGSVVNVYNDGWVLALTTGTVSSGSMLMTSNLSAGYLEATTYSTHSIVGVSFGPGASAGGLTRIKLR